MRPSGIQRLQVELCRALVVLPESSDRVFFVRHDAERSCFVATPWEAVEVLFSVMTSGSDEESKARSVAEMARSALRKAIYALPPGLRKIVLLQVAIFIGLYRFHIRLTLQCRGTK